MKPGEVIPEPLIVRTTSSRGVEFIKQHEGLRLAAYLDPVGIWTIGWGHTGRVKPGQRITLEQAKLLLASDIEIAERCVRANVTVPLAQGQFDALVSFVFNLGCGALRRSTLLGLLNAGASRDAAEQFPRWVHGGGRRLPGLVTRRRDEQALFLEGLAYVAT